MTEDQVNVAIAMHVFSGEYRVQLIAKPKSYNYKWGSKCMPTPKYASDLNAMHEALTTLSKDQRAEYAKNLFGIVIFHPSKDSDDNKNSPFMFLCVASTAKQQAEAFLRTIGKWKD